MNTEITRLDLSFRRKSIIGYSVGMALYILVIVALYPQFKDQIDLDKFVTDSPTIAAIFGISGSLTSPVGWLNSRIFGNFFPLLILLLTIGFGSWCLAGQERDGHLELVLSLPFKRSSVVVQKIVTLISQAVFLSIVVFATVLLGRAFELTLSVANIAATTAAVALLGIDFGLVAIAVGAASGDRGLALGVASVAAAASYLVSSMAPVVKWLEPLRYVSLFWWAVGDNQLEDGVQLGGFAVLIAVGIVTAVVAVKAFQRHDLS